MDQEQKYSIVVIGAGAGGLVVAIGAAKAGKKVLLVDKGNWGGDCTNYGCIPSKSLISEAHKAHAREGCQHNGNPAAALEYTRHIVSSVRHHEEPEALKKKGVDTLTGTASFLDPYTIAVTDQNGTVTKVKGDQFVIAAGSKPFIPEIEGLDSIRYYTNESIFSLQEIPRHLGVLGGGPIGSELSQAFRRLGAEVSIIQSAPHLLQKEEPQAQAVIESVFQKEGISLYLGYRLYKVAPIENGICLNFRHKENNEEKRIEVSHLLISSGRRPHLDELHLKNAGVKHSPKGIEVNAYGQTSQKHIWAVGDAVGRAIFTHVAENEARTVLKNLILPWPLRFKIDIHQPIPRVTFTDPEVASIGLLESEALHRYGANQVAVYEVSLADVDRAITTGRTEGFVKIITKKWSSHIIGATVVAPRAGEMLMEISTAIHAKLPLRKLASLIHPYPIYSHAIRKAADGWLTKTVLGSFRRQ